MKRIIAAGMMAAMSVGILSGCGGGKSTGGDAGSAAQGAGTTSTSGKKAKTQKTKDGKTIIRIVRSTNNLSSADGKEVKKVEDAINDYIDGKIDVKVELKELPSGEYAEKCNLALANNEIDMLWTASWMGAVACDSLYKGNGAYDLTDLLKGSELQKAMPDTVWEASSYDGKNYFVPIYKEIAEGYDLMFRKDLVDKHHWDLSKVKTLKDIEPMLQDCKEDGIEAPLLTQATPFAYKFLMDDYAWILGGYVGVDRKTDKVTSVFETDTYKNYVKMMADWGQKGYIQEGDATNSNPSNALQSDFWGISWWTDVPNNAYANVRYNQDVETVHMTGNWIDSNTTLGSCYAVSATCTEETAKACVDFLGLLYNDKDLADIYTFGIEGTDFTRDKDGKVTTQGDLYNHSAWESTNVMNLSLESGEPDDKLEMYEKFNDAAKPSQTSGFRFNSSSVEAQASAIGTVVNQYAMILENGGCGPDDVDGIIEQYKQAMDEAGYQDVLKAATDQYEAWKAENKK